MSAPQDNADDNEQSGVTSLRPVPVKPARLVDLAEGDSTQYFSASALLDRGKALAAQASEPAPPRTEPAALAAEAAPPRVVETVPQRPSWRVQFQQASGVRKAAAILLPVLCLALLLKPASKLVRPPAASAPSAPSARSAPSALPVAPPPAKLAAPVPPPPDAALSLPRGMTLAHAAADSVATGDYARAASLYRELSRRDPSNPAFREAARILTERAPARTP